MVNGGIKRLHGEREIFMVKEEIKIVSSVFVMIKKGKILGSYLVLIMFIMMMFPRLENFLTAT